MNELSSAPPAEILLSLLLLPANHKCFDCQSDNNDWVSLGFGIYLCVNCAGYHRSLGTHVTSVRSCKLDVWSSAQVAELAMGGNSCFRDYVDSLSLVTPISNAHSLYKIPRVLFYK
jgi:hypothetical protein